MKKALEIFNQMKNDKIIDDYAIGGAIGVIFYTEPFNTDDLDIFMIAKISQSGLVTLAPIYEYLIKCGAVWKEQFLIVEGIKVDIIPIRDLTEQAYNTAVEHTYYEIKTKVFRPEYLLAIALKTGRFKDLAHIERLLEQATLDKVLLYGILIRYDLYDKFIKLFGERIK